MRLQEMAPAEVCSNCDKFQIGIFYAVGGRKKICVACGEDYGFLALVTNAEFIMPFGKHKGVAIPELPTGYLQWGSENLRGGIQKRFQRELDERNN